MKETIKSDNQRLEIQIKAIDRKSDQAVYQIYVLTEEEIAIVGGTWRLLALHLDTLHDQR